jgi:hypothetical protein
MHLRETKQNGRNFFFFIQASIGFVRDKQALPGMDLKEDYFLPRKK